VEEDDGYDLALPVVNAEAGEAAMERKIPAERARIFMVMIYSGEG